MKAMEPFTITSHITKKELSWVSLKAYLRTPVIFCLLIMLGIKIIVDLFSGFQKLTHIFDTNNKAALPFAERLCSSSLILINVVWSP